MKTYIFRDLCRSFALALVLTCGVAACAQGPATYSVVNRCSGEVKTKVDRTTPKTPRFVGNTSYVRPGGRAAWILPFNRWSSKRPRLHRKFKVGRR